MEIINKNLVDKYLDVKDITKEVRQFSFDIINILNSYKNNPTKRKKQKTIETIRKIFKRKLKKWESGKDLIKKNIKAKLIKEFQGDKNIIKIIELSLK